MTVRILAIDTATEACSAALLQAGPLQDHKVQESEVLSRFSLAPREHTRRLLPMVDELLAEAGITLTQLDALAFGHGPGSFTGVRIATGMVQGLAFGADKPVIGISTLASMAQQVATPEHPHVLAAIDARMGEVYWGQYSLQPDGLVEATDQERVIAPEALCEAASLPHRRYLAVGTGWQAYAEQLAALPVVIERPGLLPGTVSAESTGSAGSVETAEPGCFPHAGSIARLAVARWQQGAAVAAEQALPVYLRNEVTWKKLPGR